MIVPYRSQLHFSFGLALLFTFATITAGGSLPDTTQESQLTHDGFPKRDPVFWPDGKELLYTVEAKTGHMRIVRMNLETGEIAWTTKPYGKYWSMAASGDKLLALDERGELLLALGEPSRNEDRGHGNGEREQQQRRTQAAAEYLGPPREARWCIGQ